MALIKRLYNFPSQAITLAIALKHEKSPKMPKVFALAALVYLVSPIDIVPDVIPFAGWADDLIVVPALVAISFKQIPEDILLDIRGKSKKELRRLKLLAALVVVCSFSLLYLLAWLLFF